MFLTPEEKKALNALDERERELSRDARKNRAELLEIHQRRLSILEKSQEREDKIRSERFGALSPHITDSVRELYASLFQAQILCNPDIRETAKQGSEPDWIRSSLDEANKHVVAAMSVIERECGRI